MLCICNYVSVWQIVNYPCSSVCSTVKSRLLYLHRPHLVTEFTGEIKCYKCFPGPHIGWMRSCQFKINTIYIIHKISTTSSWDHVNRTWIVLVNWTWIVLVNWTWIVLVNCPDIICLFAILTDKFNLHVTCVWPVYNFQQLPSILNLIIWERLRNITGNYWREIRRMSVTMNNLRKQFNQVCCIKHFKTLC